MAEGGGSSDQRAAKLWGYRDPKGFAEFLDRIGDCVAQHLIAQLDAGADAVQIFDSWASSLPARPFAEWVIAPTRKIVQHVRSARPGARIIGFPRAATLAGYIRYAGETGVNAVSVDTAVPPRWMAEALAPSIAVQGNLDPMALIAGGDALARATDDLLAGDARQALHLQPGSWRAAGDAARACRRAGCPRAGHAVKLAVVLFNLGGPDSPRGRRALPAQSVQRSGDHRPARHPAPAHRHLDRDAARAAGARNLRPHRRPLAHPRGNRGPGTRPGSRACRCQHRNPGLRRHALLASAQR